MSAADVMDAALAASGVDPEEPYVSADQLDRARAILKMADDILAGLAGETTVLTVHVGPDGTTFEEHKDA